MKKAFVVFGLLLGLQIAAVTASATTHAEVKFDLCGPVAEAAPKFTNSCELGKITFDGISEISVSENSSNRVDFVAYARLPVDNAPDPIVSSANFKIVFGNPVAASAFVAKVKAGQISKIVGIASKRPIYEMTYALGPIKLKSKNVIYFSAK